MKQLFLFLALTSTLLAGPTNNVPLLERAVKAGKHVHEVAPNAAKPGERPNDYGGPGRGHGRGHEKDKSPPGKGHEKKP